MHISPLVCKDGLVVILEEPEYICNGLVGITLLEAASQKPFTLQEWNGPWHG